MKTHSTRKVIFSILLGLYLTGCASSGPMIEKPSVQLTGIQISGLSFSEQTLLLSFNVDNPNPFPLPVSGVRYHVRIANQTFASGQTQGEFSIPASGSEAFDLSVELDVLNSASRVSSLLRSGMNERIEYELSGSLAVDIPFVNPLPFSATGTVATSL